MEVVDSGSGEHNRVMRHLWPIALAAPFVLFLTGARAAERTVAVFDFELVDTSLEGASHGPRADETARLAKLADELRHRLAQSGRFDVVDTAPVAARAHAANLQTCGGCDVALARDVGAQLAVTGWVQKVSNLILNLNIVVRSVDTGEVIWIKSADMRGNTDESWDRTLDYLVGNYMLAPGAL